MRILYGLMPVAFACSSATAEATPGASVDVGPPTVTAESCSARCAAKAQSCGAPTGQAQTTCASICSRAVTEAEAACLEAKSCSELIAAATQGATLASLCPGLEPAPEASGGIPAELTVAGGIPLDYVVRTTSAGELRSSLFNIASPALTVPTTSPRQRPRFAEGRLTVVSPPRRGCEAVINVVLDSGQLAVSTSGVDVLPDTRCFEFITAIGAQGATFTVENVPWDDSANTSNVTVVLRKRTE